MTEEELQAYNKAKCRHMANPFETPSTATKLETVEKLMHLMTNHRINKVCLGDIVLEVNHFPPQPPSPEHLKAMADMAKIAGESGGKEQDLETLLWSAT